VTKKELVDEVFNRLPIFWRTRIGKKRVKLIIELCFDTIIETTASGEPVKILNFAKFETRERRSHTVYCPVIGEHRKAKEHLRVIMKPSRVWRDMLQRVAGKE